jgi:hypothetical protein
VSVRSWTRKNHSFETNQSHFRGTNFAAIDDVIAFQRGSRKDCSSFLDADIQKTTTVKTTQTPRAASSCRSAATLRVFTLTKAPGGRESVRRIAHQENAPVPRAVPLGDLGRHPPGADRLHVDRPVAAADCFSDHIPTDLKR